MSNGQFFVKGGPIFIIIGGEGPIIEDTMYGGHYYDIAREHKAMLFQTEHRFYGESRPTKFVKVSD